MYFTLIDGPLDILESFMIIDKTHEPEIKIICCNYVNVLFSGPHHIIRWISYNYLCKGNQDLQECKVHMRIIVKKSYWRLIWFHYIWIVRYHETRSNFYRVNWIIRTKWEDTRCFPLLFIYLFFYDQGYPSPAQPLNLRSWAQGLLDSDEQVLFLRGYIHDCTHFMVQILLDVLNVFAVHQKVQK